MRIPPVNPSEIENTQLREKPSTDAAARSNQAGATLEDDAAVSSAALGRTVVDVESATRELDASISARLDQVREQLQGGTYAIDYDRLARLLADEGFGS